MKGDKAHEAWREQYERADKRNMEFVTQSSAEVEALYTQSDTDDFDSGEQLAYPGAFPYTRGIHPTMYRGRLWTMRQFSGFGIEIA